MEHVKNNLITLSEAQVDKSYKIEKINGGNFFNMRLLSLGFIPGEQIMVVNRYGNGPITVNVKGNKIALGRGAAVKVMISEVKKNA
ncbi:ferrous iron transport protein A [bacterium]|nr:ferrous iron transport protein A [bacterium]